MSGLVWWCMRLCAIIVLWHGGDDVRCGTLLHDCVVRYGMSLCYMRWHGVKCGGITYMVRCCVVWYEMRRCDLVWCGIRFDCACSDADAGMLLCVVWRCEMGCGDTTCDAVWWDVWLHDLICVGAILYGIVWRMVWYEVMRCGSICYIWGVMVWYAMRGDAVLRCGIILYVVVWCEVGCGDYMRRCDMVFGWYELILSYHMRGYEMRCGSVMWYNVVWSCVVWYDLRLHCVILRGIDWSGMLFHAVM